MTAAHARRTDPATSHAAAASVDNISDAQRRIVLLLALHGSMDDEGIRASWRRRWPAERISESGLRTRRSELVRLGLVQDSGRRAPTESGRGSIIWELAPREGN